MILKKMKRKINNYKSKNIIIIFLKQILINIKIFLPYILIKFWKKVNFKIKLFRIYIRNINIILYTITFNKYYKGTIELNIN